MRKGLMLGSGKRGYYNVLRTDPRIHSQSSRGIKQPQRLPIYIGGKLNLSKYQGKWHQVAANPAWFQQGCKDTTAEYTDKGKYIEVKNSCLKQGIRETRFAKAYRVGDNKLEVDFVGGRIFTGDYNVIYVDKPYKNAIVASNGYLWILSRKQKISDKDYQNLLKIANKKGYDISKLQKGGKKNYLVFANTGDLSAHGYFYAESPDEAKVQALKTEAFSFVGAETPSDITAVEATPKNIQTRKNLTEDFGAELYYKTKEWLTKKPRWEGSYGKKGGKLPDEDKQFYQNLWKRNKGKFYRGTADGKGLGYGVMGDGLYVAYDEGMAKAFARISSEESGGKPKVEVVKLPKNLKLLNYKSPTMFKIKESLGVGKWDNVADPMYAKLLTEKVKALGFDGVISDDRAEGIVIF